VQRAIAAPDHANDTHTNCYCLDEGPVAETATCQHTIIT